MSYAPPRLPARWTYLATEHIRGPVRDAWTSRLAPLAASPRELAASLVLGLPPRLRSGLADALAIAPGGALNYVLEDQHVREPLEAKGRVSRTTRGQRSDPDLASPIRPRLRLGCGLDRNRWLPLLPTSGSTRTHTSSRYHSAASTSSFALPTCCAANV